jgi:radical SAM protein with 4Fe4S-binding SPASM domain
MKRTPLTTDILRELLAQGLKPPETLTLAITGHCPLRCRHCWPDYGAGTNQGPVPAFKLKKVLQELVDLGIHTLVLTGGEPMTHPDWLDILRFACQDLAISSVCLQTTAMPLTQPHLGMIDKFRDTGLSFQVSLDGAKSITHDYVRGNGAFERTIQGLQILVEGGWGPRLSVAFTEMQHNFDEIDPLLALVDRMGIGRLVSGTLVSAGRAARSDGIDSPSPDQYRRLITRYISDDAFSSRYLRLASIAAVEWWRHRSEISGTCCTLIEHIYITAEGRMHPCVLLHADPYSAQGVFERPLTEALAEVLPRWGCLRRISLRRASEVAACRHCPYRGHCAAGCMGRAYARSGIFFAPEDRCSLRKAVYSMNEVIRNLKAQDAQADRYDTDLMKEPFRD